MKYLLLFLPLFCQAQNLDNRRWSLLPIDQFPDSSLSIPLGHLRVMTAMYETRTEQVQLGRQQRVELASAAAKMHAAIDLKDQQLAEGAFREAGLTKEVETLTAEVIDCAGDRSRLKGGRNTWRAIAVTTLAVIGGAIAIR